MLDSTAKVNLYFETTNFLRDYFFRKFPFFLRRRFTKGELDMVKLSHIYIIIVL